MSQEKVTSVEVARRAGVSQSAVSRVFTPGASASKQTAAKVRKAASELGYRPNVLARAMVSGKSRIIGLVVAYLDNQFYPNALEKLSSALQERGYHLLVFMAGKDASNIDDVVDDMLDYQVEGIIAASVSMSSDIATRCENVGVPIVFFNRSQDDESRYSVTSDNYAGGFKVAEFLAQSGHRRISYIAGWQFASTQFDREAGFKAGLQKHDLQIYTRAVGNFTAAGAADATRSLFQHEAAEKRPDAVFVANDHMAFSVMDTLRFELGLSVPNDLSVIGYDDVPISSWPAYHLTTVRQRANRMVAETVDLMLAQINGDPVNQKQIKINAPLVQRSSSAPRTAPATDKRKSRAHKRAMPADSISND